MILPRKLLFAVTASTDAATLVLISLFGPVAGPLMTVMFVVMLWCAISPIGFAVFVGLVSHVGDLELVGYDTLRFAKWALVAAFALIATVRLHFGRRAPTLEFGYVEKYFLVFGAWGLISSIFGVHPADSLVILGRMMLFFVIYELTLLMISEKAHVHILFGVLLTAMAVSAGYSFLGFSGGSFHRIRGFFANPNGYGMFLIVVLPVLAAAFSISRNRTVRWLYGLGIVIGFVSLLLSWSRSAWGGVAIEAIVFLILAKRKKALYMVIGAAIVVGIIVAASSSAFSTLSYFTRLQFGTTHRTSLWESGFEAAKGSAIVGKGFGTTFGEVMNDIRGLDPGTMVFLQGGEKEYHSHNYYIQALVAGGVPGLLIFLAFVYSALRHHALGWRSTVSANERTIHSAVIALLCGALFSCFFESGPIMGSGSYANYFWITLGMVEAIKRRKLLGEPETSIDATRV
jgi:O-antigen ligase